MTRVIRDVWTASAPPVLRFSFARDVSSAIFQLPLSELELTCTQHRNQVYDLETRNSFEYLAGPVEYVLSFGGYRHLGGPLDAWWAEWLRRDAAADDAADWATCTFPESAWSFNSVNVFGQPGYVRGHGWLFSSRNETYRGVGAAYIAGSVHVRSAEFIPSAAEAIVRAPTPNPRGLMLRPQALPAPEVGSPADVVIRRRHITFRP